MVSIPRGVTSIAANAYAGSTFLSVTIPDSVTSIGAGAFSGCTGLTTITIPNSVISIGDNAFSGCTSLTSVSMANGLKTLGDNVFYNCLIQNLVIPGSVTSCGINTLLSFYTSPGQRSNRKSGWYPDAFLPPGGNSPHIPGSSPSANFSWNWAKTPPFNLVPLPAWDPAYGWLVVPANLILLCGSGLTLSNNGANTTLSSALSSFSSNSINLYVDDYFQAGFQTGTRMSTMTSAIINWPTYVNATFIYQSLHVQIANCGGVDTFLAISGIPTVPKIFANQYANRIDNMEQLIIPDGFTDISELAFAGCTNIRNITIPSSVTSVGASAFAGCPNTAIHLALTNYFTPARINTLFAACKVFITGLLSGYTFADGVITQAPRIDISGRASLPAFPISNIAIMLGSPSGTTNIFGASATAVRTFTIPSSVVAVGPHIFQGCSNLTKIYFPTTVATIGAYALSGCTSLRCVGFPYGLKKLNAGVLQGYPTALNAVIFPATLTSIDVSDNDGLWGMSDNHMRVFYLGDTTDASLLYNWAGSGPDIGTWIHFYRDQTGNDTSGFSTNLITTSGLTAKFDWTSFITAVGGNEPFVNRALTTYKAVFFSTVPSSLSYSTLVVTNMYTTSLIYTDSPSQLAMDIESATNTTVASPIVAAALLAGKYFSLSEACYRNPALSTPSREVNEPGGRTIFTTPSNVIQLTPADSTALISALQATRPTTGTIATPVFVAVPNIYNDIPTPSWDGWEGSDGFRGSYYIAVSHTVDAHYTFQSSNCTLDVRGGVQTFNRISCNGIQISSTILGLTSPPTSYTIDYKTQTGYTMIRGVAFRSTSSPSITMVVNCLGSSIGSAVPSQSGVPCFLGDAPVLTPSGYRNIATLAVGDLVKTSTGSTVPIQAVTVRNIMSSPLVNPLLIPMGQYGATRDLAISPDHKVQVGDTMIEARFLSLERKEMSGNFSYYNLELPDYENMIVAGVTVESQYPMVRVSVTRAELKRMLIAKYGVLTPEILARVQKKVRLLADGRVEVPVDKRLLSSTQQRR